LATQQPVEGRRGRNLMAQNLNVEWKIGTAKGGGKGNGAGTKPVLCCTNRDPKRKDRAIPVR